MSPFRRYSLLLWLLLRSIPPVSPGRLLMPAIFLSGWTLLRALEIAEARAFVWAAVLAQAVQVWAVLPISAWHQRRLFGRARRALFAAVAVCFTVLALQVWWADPVFSQRVVTVYCAFYVGAMLAGILGDQLFIDRFVPVSDPQAVPMITRRHLLKLYALVAFLVIVVNETLLAMTAPLGARVAVLALLPIALHIFYEIVLRLTLPLEDDPEPEP
ncbi:hypothetical protein [Marimonas arenosa]|uniref:Uncharacterized protein n=1 Tax=Marimonas arenosa TaxID=1795305 RepID=A0AAE4B746_9RHOB|nr:hypothetical protein [Marimonas arenosa]MDQ2091999.1 hypothetical protein [Marimonas arenosa]